MLRMPVAHRVQVLYLKLSETWTDKVGMKWTGYYCFEGFIGGPVVLGFGTEACR